MNVGRRPIYGIFWLRAFFSICVVEWHTLAVGKSLIFSKIDYKSHQYELSDFLNFQVFLLAVPIFLAISCYLFATRKPDAKYFWTRAKHLILLSFFWSVFLNIWTDGIFKFITSIPLSPWALMEFIARAGNTPYYFFLCLMVLLGLCLLASRLNNYTLWLLTIFSILLVALMPMISTFSGFIKLSAWWHPLPFLPYPFASTLLFRYSRELHHWRFPVAALSLGAAIISGFFEWKYYVDAIYFSIQPYALPAYMRPSVFFACYSLLVLFLGPWSNCPAFIRFLSDYSLTLYCLHLFFIPIVVKYASTAAPIFQSRQIQVVLVLLLSYAGGMFLKLFFKKSLLVSSSSPQS
jgi:hypothetical protein